jgi:hypothetical protein
LTSKTYLVRFYENSFPRIVDRTISLHLSNDNDTPQQIQLFLFQNYQLRQFIHLKSLTLAYVRSKEILHRVLDECSYLPCLTHLIFTDGIICRQDCGNVEDLINKVWSLPKLKYCQWNIDFDYGRYLSPSPTVISTSIRHVIIDTFTCTQSTLRDICEHTPNIKYLSVNVINGSRNSDVLSPMPSINRLKIRLYDDTFSFKALFQNMPNLHHLSLKFICPVYINGYKWEKIITTYLPKLKIFQFRMRRELKNIGNMESQVNEILNSFSTKFWTDEHKWFVRCDYYEYSRDRSRAYIEYYTLPYTFNSRFSYDDSFCVLTKSTCSHYDQYRIFDNLIKLSCNSSNYLNSIISFAHFRNIQCLTLTFPLNEDFFSAIPSLDRLSSLRAHSLLNQNFDLIHSQLKLFIDRQLHLRSLQFHLWPAGKSLLQLSAITSTSIRRLNLQEYQVGSDWRCFQEEECIELSNSPLGQQCETLLIKVKSRGCILNLVNHMPKLQALTVRCLDDTLINEENYETSTNYELIKWLCQQLPTTYSVARNTIFDPDVLLWIR